MAERTLKKHKIYKVPGKDTTWRVEGNKLYLNTVCFNGDKSLPPKELGRCIKWKYKYTDIQDKSIFMGEWDLRRVEHYLHNIDTISNRL